jgi:uncharacterized protein
MDADEIIDAFASAGKELPVAAMLWCRDEWDTVAPALLGVLARYEDGSDRSDTAGDALFFILHMMGDRGETRAFAPLCRLAHDREAIEAVLGDGITESLSGILIRIYDGDPGHLTALVEDPGADEYVRAEALEAMGFLAAAGRIAMDEIAAWLRRLHDSVLPQEEAYLWHWWAFVVVLLRLEPMGALIDDAFARGLMPLEICDEDGFRDIRAEALGDADPLASFRREGIEPFEDAIGRLSHWSSFSDDGDLDDEPDDGYLSRFDSYEEGPAVNPYKDVGRNDPCPCGSGKKFKKCCLGVAPA